MAYGNNNRGNYNGSRGNNNNRGGNWKYSGSSGGSSSGNNRGSNGAKKAGTSYSRGDGNNGRGRGGSQGDKKELYFMSGAWEVQSDKVLAKATVDIEKLRAAIDGAEQDTQVDGKLSLVILYANSVADYWVAVSGAEAWNESDTDDNSGRSRGGSRRNGGNTNTINNSNNKRPTPADNKPTAPAGAEHEANADSGSDDDVWDD